MNYFTSVGDIITTIHAAIPAAFAPLFFLGAAITVVNGLFLFLFVVVGSRFLDRMKIGSGTIDQEKRDTHLKSEALLDEARKQSVQIIEEANKKAKELLVQTQTTKETLDADLKAALQQFSQKENERVKEVATQMVDAYRSMMDSTKQQYTAAISSTAKEMADGAQRSLKEFEESLKNQTTRYEGVLKEQIQAGFMSAQKEISDYKRESLRKVEEGIYHILNLVTKSILGKALSLEDQQDLVIHALNEAKQQGFFEI